MTERQHTTSILRPEWRFRSFHLKLREIPKSGSASRKNGQRLVALAGYIHKQIKQIKQMLLLLSKSSKSKQIKLLMYLLMYLLLFLYLFL